MADDTDTQPINPHGSADLSPFDPANPLNIAHAAEREQREKQQAIQTAPDRLRAFEDAHFGKTAVRLHGRVERGFGSPFKAMLPEKHQHYAALEKLVTTEQALSDARGALLAAEAAHETAGADAAKFED